MLRLGIRKIRERIWPNKKGISKLCPYVVPTFILYQIDDVIVATWRLQLELAIGHRPQNRQGEH